MANPAAEARARVLAAHPEAVVVERGRYYIKCRLADGPDGRPRYVLDSWLPPIAGGAPDTIDRQVAAGADDAFEKDDNSGFDGTGSYHDLTPSAAPSLRENLGFRFATVSVPAGATVDVAYLSPYMLDAGRDSPNVIISANDVDDAANFTDEADVTGRARTGEDVSWVDTDIGTGFQNSPSIVDVIQEVVDRPGWAEDQAMVIFLDSGSSGSGNLRVAMYEVDSAKAAKLHIEYTAAGGVDVTVTAVTATATAAAPIPAITAIKNVTITAVTATATAAAPLPAFSTTTDVTITAVTATATADAPLPAIAAIKNVTITAVTAEATAAACPPAITTIRNVTVTAVTATATAAGSLPTITAVKNVTVSAVTATATAAASLPAVGIHKTITAVTATATAAAPLPTIAAIKNVTISAVTATATAAAPLPSLGVHKIIVAVTATATAAAPLPTITTVRNVTITAVTATATAAASLPTVGLATFAQFGEIIASINPNDYPTGTTLKLLAVIWTSDGAKPVYARLYNVTDSVVEGESVVNSDSESAAEVLSSALSLPSGDKTYRIEVGGIAGGTFYCAKAVVRGTV